MFKAEIISEPNEDICILLKVENHSFNYICECGEAKNLTVKDCQNANAIFISHTHIDHFVNFDTILRHQIGIQRRVVIVGPLGIINQVQNRIKSYCWNLIEKGAISYEIREIITENHYNSAVLQPPFWEKEEEKTVSEAIIFKEKQFSVTYSVLDHKTNSIAYLFKANDSIKITLSKDFKGGKWVSELKTAFKSNDENKEINVNGKLYKSKDLFDLIHVKKGKRLGLIMDHAAHEENHLKIKNKFTDCDEVFMECFYKNDDKEFAIKNYHSYAAKSGEIMKLCNVDKAIPVHFSRKYNEQDIIALIAEFEAAKN